MDRHLNSTEALEELCNRSSQTTPSQKMVKGAFWGLAASLVYGIGEVGHNFLFPEGPASDLARLGEFFYNTQQVIFTAVPGLFSMHSYLDGLTSLKKNKEEAFFYREDELSNRSGELTNQGTLSSRLFGSRVTPIDDFKLIEPGSFDRYWFMNGVKVLDTDIERVPDGNIGLKYGLPISQREVNSFEVRLKCDFKGTRFVAEKKTRDQKMIEELSGVSNNSVYLLVKCCDPEKLEVRDFGPVLERAA